MLTASNLSKTFSLNCIVKKGVFTISGRKIDVRKKKILELLADEGQVRVAQLSELLDTTVVTIRSDLAALEHEGLLERVPGGAVQTSLGYYNLEFQKNKLINAAAKRSIAQAATELVQDGDTIFMNGGTTTYYTALELKKRKKLIVVTNSINVAIELGVCPSFTVILLGGEIRPHYSFTYGTEALDHLQRYRATHAIISIDGICETGISTVHPQEAIIARTMIDRADTTTIVGDASKIGKESFVRICSVSSLDYFITDSSADKKHIQELKNLGIKVIVA